MLVHAALKPFWPVVFLLPWCAVGALYLLKWALDLSKSGLRASTTRVANYRKAGS